MLWLKLPSMVPCPASDYGAIEYTFSPTPAQAARSGARPERAEASAYAWTSSMSNGLGAGCLSWREASCSGTGATPLRGINARICRRGTCDKRACAAVRHKRPGLSPGKYIPGITTGTTPLRGISARNCPADKTGAYAAQRRSACAAARCLSP